MVYCLNKCCFWYIILQINHYIYIFAYFATYIINMAMPSKVTIWLYIVLTISILIGQEPPAYFESSRNFVDKHDYSIICYPIICADYTVRNAHCAPQVGKKTWAPFSSPEPAILLACGRNRELWEQPFWNDKGNNRFLPIRFNAVCIYGSCLKWLLPELLTPAAGQIVQSLNSPFFPPHIGAEPGRAKEESRIILACACSERTNKK